MKKLIGVLFILLTSAACSIVGPGDRGIRLNAGEAQKDILEPGMHLYIPVLRTISHMSVRVQKDEFTTNSASKDMQDVTTIIAINWSVDPAKVYNVYTNLGTMEAIETKVLRPAINEVLKSATAKLTAEEILTRRIELKKDIDEALELRMSKYGLIVADTSIVDLDFSAQFTQAIENKQIAEQLAKEAEYLAVKRVKDQEGVSRSKLIEAEANAKAQIIDAKANAESKLLRAQAEAKANVTVSKSLTKDLIQYEKVKNWNGQLPKFVGGGNTGTLVNIGND